MVRKKAYSTVRNTFGPDNEDLARMADSMIGEAPQRLMLTAGGDVITPQRFEALLTMFNGHFLKGLSRLLKMRK